MWERHCVTATRVLELGANVGYYTVIGAAACRGVYTAVEPNPEAAGIIRANLALNEITNAVVVEAAVVPEAMGQVRLALPDQERYVAPSGAYLDGAEDVHDRRSSRAITVNSIGISELLADGCDLLKMDIEGYEHAVLAAALPKLLELRPVIFLEVRPAATQLREWVSDHLSRDWSTQEIGERDVILSPRE